MADSQDVARLVARLRSEAAASMNNDDLKQLPPIFTSLFFVMGDLLNRSADALEAANARIFELERENKHVKVFEAGITAERDSANARIEAALGLCDEAQQFEDSPDFEGNHYGCPGALHTSEVRAALTGKGSK